MLFVRQPDRGYFSIVVLGSVICSLVLILACSTNDESSPVVPAEETAFGTTKQVFDLFGPVEFICFCEDGFPDRESGFEGEKVLPMRVKDYSLGEDVSLFSGDFSMVIWDVNQAGEYPHIAQLQVYLDDVLVADRSNLTVDQVTIPLTGVTENSSLRVEYAGECFSGIGIRIEGVLAEETAVIEAGGGAILVDDPASPLDGVTLVVPAGAITGSTLFSVQEATNPPPADPSIVPLGSVADVSSSHEGDFIELLQLTFPLPQAFPTNAIPYCAYYDESSATWIPANSRLSADEQSITVYTNHLSDWVQFSLESSPEMITAFELLSEVNTDLQAVLAEIDENSGQMRCSELAVLRNDLASSADTYGAGLDSWAGSGLACADEYCGDEGLNASSIIRDIEFFMEDVPLVTDHDLYLGISELVQILVNGTDRQAVHEIANTLFWSIFRICDTCMVLGNGEVSDYEALFGFVMSAAGVELIDKSIAADGCTFVPTGEDILVPPLSVPMPATFTMGSIYGAPPWEETQHQVTLTNRFYMGEAEVTNGEYVEALQWAYDQGYVSVTSLSVLGALDGATAELVDMDDSYCQIDFSEGVFTTFYSDYPVRTLTWWGAIAYCDWLNMQDGLSRVYNHSTGECNGGNPYSALGYRLPTEAEWEFACRAGTTTEYSTGDCLDSATEANYFGDYTFGGCPAGPILGESAIAGSYPPNPWGLYSMHGNMREWCNDWVGPYDGDEVNPTGSDVAGYRSLRGGNWLGTADQCRSAYRGGSLPWAATNMFTGFRIVKTAY